MTNFSKLKNQPTGHINNESDFIVNILLNEKVGDRDFRIDFFTNPNRMVRFTRYNGVMSSNLKASNNGGVFAIFRKHELTPGRLQAKATFVSKTDLSPDGEMVDVLPITTDVELVSGAGDMGLIPVIELSLTQFFPSTDNGNGDDDNENDDGGNTPTPIPPAEDFTPTVTPASGAVTRDAIKKTIIQFPSPIAVFNGADVHFSKNFGNVWYDYAAKGTIADDKMSMTIEWDFAPEVGLNYTLELPAGCIELGNGAKNLELKVLYNVIE